jgi:anti-anti-sigma regulatory factor
LIFSETLETENIKVDELRLGHIFSEDNTLHISMQGRLCIDTTQDLLFLLKENLDKAARVAIDPAGVTEADLSGVQLICSACRTALTQHKGFCFKTDLPDCMKKTVESIGLQRSVSCKHNADMACIWSGGII